MADQTNQVRIFTYLRHRTQPAEVLQKATANKPDNATALSELNKATFLGAGGAKQDLPVVTTASGERIPTGTIGALLVNIKLHDNAHAKT